MKVKLYAQGVIQGGGLAGVNALQLVEGIACKLAMIPLGPAVKMVECTEFDSRMEPLEFKRPEEEMTDA